MAPAPVQTPYNFRLSYAGEDNIQLVSDAIVRCSIDTRALKKAGQILEMVNSKFSWRDRILHPELFNTPMSLYFDFPVKKFQLAVAQGSTDAFFLTLFDQLAAIVDRCKGNYNINFNNGFLVEFFPYYNYKVAYSHVMHKNVL